MSKLNLKQPGPGTVLGFIALMVALAGNANAFSNHTTIVRKGQIAKGAVTAKALAPGAVHAIALAKGAVNAKALAKGAVGGAALSPGAVGAGALAPDAVTAAAIAPGSVYGGALGAVTTHTAPIADLDAVPSNPEWTMSDVATAACGAGEHLLTGGIVFTNPGNREVGVLESLPFTSATSGYVGRITSNSGGTASAEVQAVCLK